MKEDGISKPVDPIQYQSIIGSLLYLAVATRPDIAYAVQALSNPPKLILQQQNMSCGI